MPDSNAEQLAQQAADAVRQAVVDAETRAQSILQDAEAEAARIRERAEGEARQIRERAEADARAQIESAKRALDQLGGSLTAAVEEALPRRGESPAASEAPASPPAPDPGEPAPEQPSTEPETQPQPEESPSAPEAPASPSNGDDAAERLVAMKLAVEGKDPAAIEAELIEKFGPGDRNKLLHEVVDRVSR